MDTNLIPDVCRIISLNYGEYTAELYEKYYADKSQAHILISLQELLTEMVGPEKAKEQLDPLLKKYNINDITSI